MKFFTRPHYQLLCDGSECLKALRWLCHTCMIFSFPPRSFYCCQKSIKLEKGDDEILDRLTAFLLVSVPLFFWSHRHVMCTTCLAFSMFTIFSFHSVQFIIGFRIPESIPILIIVCVFVRAVGYGWRTGKQSCVWMLHEGHINGKRPDIQAMTFLNVTVPHSFTC